MPALVINHVTKKYGDKTVLKDVNLTIEEGAFYALMGPNGSGKTTLASIIASVRRPTSGFVEVFGRTPEAAKDVMGYVPQENFSSPMLTGKENLLYFAGLLGYAKREAASLVEALLQQVGLRDDANKRVAEYSGGMRKRLEVATILFPHMKLLILDEPTTGLDPSARRKFLGMLHDLRDEMTTILLITHIGADAEVASRVGLIDAGEIIAEGDPDGLKRASGLENVINVETAIKTTQVATVLSAFSEQRRVLETEGGYRVFSRDVEATTPTLVRELDAIGCKATKIEIVKPSLEDVFFQLTEKPVSEVE
jgi:ABC-2 type transport system ATP-binding protein